MSAPADRSRRVHRRWTAAAIGAFAIVVVVAAVTVVSTGAGRTAAAAKPQVPLAPTIDVTAASCGGRWPAPKAGHPVFEVANRTNAAYDVDLVGPDQQTVYAEIETLAPRTRLALPVTLPPGRYEWRCTRADGLVTFSPVAAVTGPSVRGAHPFIPVTYNDLSTAATAYRAEVARAMEVLARETDALRAAVADGQLDTARALWLVAHLQYERLGAAYGTFGDFDSKVNGSARGLPKGERDPGFVGFHRLELLLWSSRPVLAVDSVELRAIAARLDGDVHALVAAFPHLQTPPNDVALRTHEILENALQFEMTGENDYGSHTGLATVRANVDGTEMTLAAVAPLLRARDPALLSVAAAGLRGLATMLDQYGVDGRWTPVNRLSRAEHERIDATLSGVLEQLSPIPDLLELPKDADDS